MDKKRNEELLIEAKNFFNAHKKEIGESIRTGQNVVRLEFRKIAEFSPKLSESIIEFPEETSALIEMALEESGLVSSPRIRFENLPQSSYIKIRNIRAKHLDQILWIEGIVRQASEVRPQVVNAKFECPTCGAILSVLQVDRKFREPSRCSCQWKGPFKIISKEMVDVQRLVIEESPDSLEGGQQPRRINVFIKEDLVEPKMEERTTPGSKIKVYGILKEIPVPLQTGAISTRFDIAVETNNIIPLEESFEDFDISEEDIKQILELAADPNIFKRLSKSLAPSIYGFEQIKEAVLLQLFGGIKKTKSDGGSTRGDIHILLVGDPGVAKSVLLKYTSTIAPKGRYVSGKAATAAGLCVSPKSMLLTNPGGISTIENIVEKRLDNKIEYVPGVWKKDNIKDVKIQSMSHDLKIHSKNPQSIWKLEAPKEVYEITLTSGKKVELTGNTQLLVLDKGKEKWIKSKDLEVKSYIATPRRLIEGEIKEFFFVDLINSNPVVHDIKGSVKEIVAKLKEKYGDIRKAARSLDIKENQLYHHWINKTARGNIKIKDLKKIADAVGFNWKEKVNKISLYNGKRHNIPTFLDKDVLYLAGLIAGDGDVGDEKSGSVSLRFSNSNKDLQNIFRSIVKDKFNLKCNVLPGNDKRPEASRFHSKIIGEAIKALGIPFSPKSDKITLSETLLHLNNELIAEYIAGLYDTDGSIFIRKGEGSNCIDLTTCSETLARQLQLVLIRYGIHARLRKRLPSPNKKIKSKLDKYILEIREISQIKKFAKFIKLRHPEKRAKLSKLASLDKKKHTNVDILPGVGERLRELLKSNDISLKNCSWHSNLSRRGLKNILNNIGLKDSKELNEIKNLAYSDILWDKIISINRKIPDYEYVYDLTVEDSHNFVVDGILVHNTAAVVKDEFLRGWSLEAGAMVLSNKGTVCIDEIEKMNEQDRSAMHEALEQQTVTISKANIHATLRAETTVLAAGNPKLGRFDPYTPIPQQIDISPALLSRFDVIFVIRDLPNKTQDEAIASHVLEEHKKEVIRDVLDPKLMRKYIAYARQKVKPRLTDEAVEEIKEFYVKLRNQTIRGDSGIKPIPITARQLEGIIRLSEAHAKLRLSDEVSQEDAKRAISLLKMSLSQVGFDEETQSFDIDKITTGITSSKRGKIVLVKEILSQLETRLGKQIPLEEIQGAINGRISNEELEEALSQLSKAGDIFQPKKGFIQRI